MELVETADIAEIVRQTQIEVLNTSQNNKPIYMCKNQFCKPEYLFPLTGQGDCRICKTDENNRHCTGYHPIPVRTFTVVEPNYRD